jgi:hypothetical protein
VVEKKHRNDSAEQLRKRIDPDDRQLSVRRQCELLGLPRSTLYAGATDRPAARPRARGCSANGGESIAYFSGTAALPSLATGVGAAPGRGIIRFIFLLSRFVHSVPGPLWNSRSTSFGLSCCASA